MITYSAPEKSYGAKYSVNLEDKVLSSKIEKTGLDFEYKTFNLGEIDFTKSGKSEIIIAPDENLDSDLMYFKSIELISVEG